jgi:hypothetical protein
VTTLYKRASPPQHRVLHIIEGAIKNASDAHKEIKVSLRHRRSIAKRAAGTLTAQWPEVLAATRRSGGLKPVQTAPSENTRLKGLRSPRMRALARFTEARDAGRYFNPASEAGEPLVSTLPLLGVAETALRACAGPLVHSGDTELAEAIIAVLKIIGTRRKLVRRETI